MLDGLDRRRVPALIAGCVAFALCVALVAAATLDPEPRQAEPEPVRSEPLQGQPPLVLDLPDRLLPAADGEARLRALQAAGDPAQDADLALALAATYLDLQRADDARASLEDAARTLGPDDLRVAVGRALASYRREAPDGSLAALAALAAEHPSEPLAGFHRGLALLFAGRPADASDALRRSRDAAPEGFYGTRSDNLLHPGMAPGYPLWIPSRTLPEGDLERLQQRVREAPADADAALALAALLQGQGRRQEARAAAQRAVAADPGDLDAQVAVAVLGFDKDRPADAVGAIGLLARANGAAVAPRFHLGELLTWLRRDAQARDQYRRAAELDPGGRLGEIAKRLAGSPNG